MGESAWSGITFLLGWHILTCTRSGLLLCNMASFVGGSGSP